MLKWKYDRAGLGERLLPAQHRRESIRNEHIYGIWRDKLGWNSNASSWNQLRLQRSNRSVLLWVCNFTC